ncbi:YceI family protein [Winogradskyella sp.]|jgi:polyisoprenoid-binding protein YceI|uniref:YceI family protein n=1 Tax=Winogradskyella sp. TaxID=1883156 RepID=UPI0025E81A05|nr:YceI family protein [Winogradskyella sp.]MCT4629400.1 YceI family protein [Winogradskyella sp.]
MKKNILRSAFILVLALALVSFTSKTSKKVDVSKSKVTWKGYKVTGSHEGTINLKSGVIELEDDKLIGGNFTMDMTSINTTDIKGEYAKKLDGHLKSDDFFGTDNYPTSTLKITDSESKGKNTYSVTADLTIKGKTHPVTFNISINGSKATANLKIDRTKYDIKYGSSSFFDNLKDKAIDNEFDLTVDLQF